MMVNVIGLGYIGLPTALMLASHGVTVVGTDYNKALIDTLNSGKTTFYEKGLEEIFQKAIQAGIRFESDYQQTNIYIVSVPTPYDEISKKVDSSYVIAAVHSIMKVCQKESIVIIESTIAPGTIDEQIRPIIAEYGLQIGVDIHLAHAPERIIPGNMIYELLHNNRTIGVDNKEIGARIKELYASFCLGEIVVTDIRTAEMSKVVENTYRAVNIAFANELSRICHQDNMDIYEIIRICNMHPRVNILQPGPGVGGHCISVDPWFLVGRYRESAKLTECAMQINAHRPQDVLSRMDDIIKEHNLIQINRVGLYGLTYKENVDDCRESPTLQLLNCRSHPLVTAGLKIYDPFITADIVENQYHDFDKFLDDVDFLVIMVKHQHIIENQNCLIGKIILDCHNIIHIPKTYYL